MDILFANALYRKLNVQKFTSQKKLEKNTIQSVTWVTTEDVYLFTAIHNMTCCPAASRIFSMQIKLCSF